MSVTGEVATMTRSQDTAVALVADMTFSAACVHA
jgi:hypothetical protein